MGTSIGAQKSWAIKLGISYEEYLQKIETGFKRCTKCHEWKPYKDYPKDSSRKDGLNTKCHECIRVDVPKKPVIPEWAKEALRERNRKNKWRKGIPLSQEHRAFLRKISYEQQRFHGENSPQWKGGITPENRTLRRNSANKQWRQTVYERDNYTCQHCGDDKGGNLNAHHKMSWSDYPELRYVVDNGITLCEKCHEKIHDKPNSLRKKLKAKRGQRE